VTSARAVHFLVPAGIDDPARPSGGNIYDRRIADGLGASGWSVIEHHLSGAWPWPDSDSQRDMAHVLAALVTGSIVLIDGLIASSAAALVVPEASRLRIVILLHMPLGQGTPQADVERARASERAVLTAAAAVITTSSWTTAWVASEYGVPLDRLQVAEPGAFRADLAPGTAQGGRFICVAAVIPSKGHDVLFDALNRLVDRPWTCACIGSLERDPAFVAALRAQIESTALSGRVGLCGPRVGADLDANYAAADLLVLASHRETYGMVITEALARGLPVVASAVDAVPATLGRTSGGTRPGLLVEPGGVESGVAHVAGRGGSARPAPGRGPRATRRFTRLDRNLYKDRDSVD
jgi:glycosyltransferase involved in cell wall biosynthesis